MYSGVSLALYLDTQFKITSSGKGYYVDWPTVAIIVTIIISVGGFLWGIVAHRQNLEKNSTKESEENLATRLELLEAWRHEISSTINELRQEIEHVKEVGDIKDQDTKEQLTRMEAQLRELVNLLIVFMNKN